jgi:hypothetical protein
MSTIEKRCGVHLPKLSNWKKFNSITKMLSCFKPLKLPSRNTKEETKANTVWDLDGKGDQPLAKLVLQ